MGGPLQTGQVSLKSVRWLVPPLPGPFVDALLRGTKKFTIEKSCINVTAAKVHLNACFVIVREQEVI